LGVVLDTNVLIRAHGKSRARARRIFADLLRGPHRLVLSNEIIVEVTKVLRYPDFQNLYGLSESDLLEYSQFLQSVSDLVILDPRYRAPLRDPSDLVVLQTADRGMADVLCTSDTDFYEPDVMVFCGAKGIEICSESSLLARLV
jgi:putative PIN family toxin of toxin-antitoxin system